MRFAKLWKLLPLYGLCALLLNISPVAVSAALISSEADSSAYLMLADAELLDLDKEKPRSGSLVLPATADEEKSEKKCMTVCQRWGQECMIDATRGIRKCRRTCKEFGQECF